MALGMLLWCSFQGFTSDVEQKGFHTFCFVFVVFLYLTVWDSQLCSSADKWVNKLLFSWIHITSCIRTYRSTCFIERYQNAYLSHLTCNCCKKCSHKVQPHSYFAPECKTGHNDDKKNWFPQQSWVLGWKLGQIGTFDVGCLTKF